MLYTEFPLDERLQRALATSGFISTTPIQAAALPLALAGRDLVGTAQTGTGKTAVYVLPILQDLIAMPSAARKMTRALILAPTRELVEQILSVVHELGVHTNVRAVAVYGGVAMLKQTRALRSGVEIVIACPGRLLDHMTRGNTNFRNLDCLVLDEADRMLDMGFLPTIQEIINEMPVKRQTMLFSATFASTLNAFVEQTLRNPVRIAVDTAVPAQTVRHTLYHVEHGQKTAMLTSLLRQLIPDSDSVLIFTNTRVTANQLAGHLHAEGMHADVLHAEKTQRERQETLDQFRAGELPYLVATDIAARGIDVTSISHVINFDLPPRADDYLHRIGRTGRMERAGHAISLMCRGDGRALREIERMLGKRIEVAQLEGSDAVSIPHDAPARPIKHHTATRVKVARSVQTMDETPRNRPVSPGRDKAPARSARPGTRHAEAAPPSADRPQGKRDANAPPSRPKRPKKQFATANSTEWTPRHEQKDHQHRHEDTTPAPKRRARSADTRTSDTGAFSPAHQERPRRKPFTGMAASFHRKPAPGKRKPGEVPSGPRPQHKSGGK